MASRFTRGVGLFSAGATLAFSVACSSGEQSPLPPKTAITVECGDAAALQAQADSNKKTADGSNNYNGILQARAASVFYGALAIAATEKCTTGDVPAADKSLTDALAEARTAESASDYREITNDWSIATGLAELAIGQLMAAAQTSHPSAHSS